MTSDNIKKSKATPIRFNFPIDIKKEEFLLDFNSVCSDRSTTDNVVSDDDPKTNKIHKFRLKP
jgi:hypothetical protein